MKTENKKKIGLSILLAFMLAGTPLILLTYSNSTIGDIDYQPITGPIEPLPINLPPYCSMDYGMMIHMTANTEFRLGKSINFVDMFTDPETRQLMYFIEYQESYASIEIYDTYLATIVSKGIPSESVITILASDGFNQACYNITLRIEPRNQCNLLEDTPISYDIMHLLPRTLEEYSLEASEHVSVRLDYKVGQYANLLMRPSANWSGTGNAKLTFHDSPYCLPTPPQSIELPYSDVSAPIYLYGCFEFDIEVQPVNDPPYVITQQLYEIDITSDTSAGLPVPLNLDVIFADIDSELVFSWTTTNGLFTVNIMGSTVSEISAASAGRDQLILLANDGEYSCCYEIPVTILDREAISMQEDTDLDIDLSDYYNPSTQNCSLSGTDSISADIQWNLQGTLIARLNPCENWYGDASILLTTFPKLMSVPFPHGPQTIYSSSPGPIIPPPPQRDAVYGIFEFDVNVAAVNDPPMVIGCPPLSMEEDEVLQGAFNLRDCFYDVDSELEMWLDDSGADFISADINQYYDVSLFPAPNRFGTGTIMAFASDGEYTISFEIPVRVLPVNDVPYITDASDEINIDEDTDITLHLTDYISDIDSPVWFSYLADQDDASFALDQDSWELVVSPIDNWFGEIHITLFGSDGEYELARNLTVNVAPVNDPPIITSLPAFAAEEGTSIEIVLSEYISDIDSELQYFGYSFGGFLMAQFGANDGLTVRAHNEDWNGMDEVRILATDGEFVVVLDIPIEILPVNDAPQFVPASLHLFMTEDMPSHLALTGLFIDPDDETLHYSITAGDGLNVRFEADSGLLEILPQSDWNGETNIAIVASDGLTFAHATVPVSVMAVNDPPTVTHDELAVLLKAGNSTTFTLSGLFTDVDSETLTLELLGSEHVQVTALGASGIYTITASESWEGIEYLTVRASDGIDTVEAKISVTAYVPRVEVQTAQVSAGYLQSIYWMVLGMGIASIMIISYVSASRRTARTVAINKKPRIL